MFYVQGQVQGNVQAHVVGTCVCVWTSVWMLCFLGLMMRHACSGHEAACVAPDVCWLVG